MKSLTNWEFYKQDKDKILYLYICAQNLTRIAVSVNEWWKTRYLEYKIRVVSKKEFEHVKFKKGHKSNHSNQLVKLKYLFIRIFIIMNNSFL